MASSLGFDSASPLGFFEHAIDSARSAARITMEEDLGCMRMVPPSVGVIWASREEDSRRDVPPKGLLNL
jgi:hypothetical protein